MSDGDLLLRRILETPEDDTVRLAYADWLDEQPVASEMCGQCDGKGEVRYCDAAGDMDDEPCKACGGNLRGGYNRGTGVIPDTRNRNRAAFIREQINRAIHERSDGYSRTPLKIETDLLAADELTFARPCGEVGFQANSTWVPECEYTLTRGFVSRISLPLAHFMEHAGAIFRAQPITGVELGDRVPNATEYGMTWNRGRNHYRSTDGIPPTIFDLMPLRAIGDSYKCAGTLELARAALSRACVAYGRNLVGLPPLPQ